MRRSKTAPPCCFICKSTEDDELLFGKIYTKWRLRVHYYCLLLSSNMIQNGESDEEGIFGFLEKDIRTEEARIQNQKCYLCKERYANVHCCAKKCFRTFHTICGIRNGCLSHFVDTYQSWCDKHVELRDAVKHSETDVCGICYDGMGPYNRVESIHAPCCQNGWFHRRCVAQFAQTAGYFFKCPLCNNKDDFTRFMQQRGVFVPEKDAAWELEPNAFGEQLERPSVCDAEECFCRHGREYDDEKWDLRLCETCGSTCRHDLCMEVPTKNYVCAFCRPIVGDEAPAAVLALAEASRRAEAARLAAAASSSSSDESDDLDSNGRESGIHSPGSSSGGSSSTSTIGGAKANRKIRQIPSDSTSSSDIGSYRKIKTKKRRIDSSESTASSSPVVRSKKRKSWSKQKSVLEQSEESDSGSEVCLETKKCRRMSTSSFASLSSRDGEDCVNLQMLLKIIPLKEASVEKLIKLKPIVQLPKLSEDQIRMMSSAEAEAATFDFNYRVRLNKTQRRKTMTDLQQSIKDAIRSDTDTLTDGSASLEKKPTKTPKKTFSKPFKLKLLLSKSASQKRVVSTSSESDLDVPAKKLCSSRIELFPPDNSENTCPNSPKKTASKEESIVSMIKPSPAKLQATNASLFSPVSTPKTECKEKKLSTAQRTVGSNQKTLTSFFKISPPISHEVGSATGCSAILSSPALSTPSSSSAAAGKSTKSMSASGSRKKLAEVDRSQKNLLDFFNRC
ncbi:serine-rich adhesin for platelets-like isoform X2 [Wyeomyia smithii]|uniref:serine-rich adhesin for platelets-like isoform X2 n=1 Tax=Wyeomyia smithii TaxID=174621 RepID=UPI0024681C3C|nr:serine-rich adhesin for platelets-like isoform X2 [Wyeomyia smithii]